MEKKCIKSLMKKIKKVLRNSISKERKKEIVSIELEHQIVVKAFKDLIQSNFFLAATHNRRYVTSILCLYFAPNSNKICLINKTNPLDVIQNESVKKRIFDR